MSEQLIGLLERIIAEVREFGVTDRDWNLKLHSDAVQMGAGGKTFGKSTYELTVTVDRKSMDELKKIEEEIAKSPFVQAMRLEAENFRRRAANYDD